MTDKVSLSSGSMRFLKEEFSETWSHLRHVEDQRNKYLGYSLTMFLGTIGYVVAVAKDFDPSTDSPWMIVGIYVLTCFVSVILTLLLMVIIKCGYVLNFYIRKRHWIRSEIYGSQSEELIRELDIHSQKESKYTSPLFQLQRISKYLLLIFIALILLGQIIVLKLSWNLLDDYMQMLTLTCLIIVLGFPLLAYSQYLKTK